MTDCLIYGKMRGCEGRFCDLYTFFETCFHILAAHSNGGNVNDDHVVREILFRGWHGVVQYTQDGRIDLLYHDHLKTRETEYQRR